MEYRIMEKRLKERHSKLTWVLLILTLSSFGYGIYLFDEGEYKLIPIVASIFLFGILSTMYCFQFVNESWVESSWYKIQKAKTPYKKQ